MTEFATQYDSTGAKDPVDVKRTGRLSIVVSSENGDATFTVEGKLKTNWYELGGTVEDGKIKSTQGPLEAIRLNISDLGTSSTVDFEVLGD